jgi:hypothetical protein
MDPFAMPILESVMQIRCTVDIIWRYMSVRIGQDYLQGSDIPCIVCIYCSLCRREKSERAKVCHHLEPVATQQQSPRNRELHHPK